MQIGCLAPSAVISFFVLIQSQRPTVGPDQKVRLHEHVAQSSFMTVSVLSDRRILGVNTIFETIYAPHFNKQTLLTARGLTSYFVW